MSGIATVSAALLTASGAPGAEMPKILVDIAGYGVAIGIVGASLAQLTKK